MANIRTPNQLPEWARDMVRVCGDDLIQDIVRDNAGHCGVPERSGLIPTKPGSDKVTPLTGENTRGWQPAAPLKQPDGVREIDRLCDAADRVDRAEWRKRGGPV
jgi:hypothetical protein